MTVDQLRKNGWIIYEVISGSHAYGTNIEGSDIDIRGCFVIPNEYILSNQYVEQVSDKNNDVTFYEIGRFLELASKGNPNMMDLLNVSPEFVKYKNPVFDEYFTEEIKKSFITAKLKHTFCGYAHSQIKKAKGLNKKINWDKQKITRKDVLDFCYVLGSKESSMSFKKWCHINYGNVDPYIVQKDIGLAKVNNFPDMYTMYLMGISSGWGIIGEDSNDVRLTSIPINTPTLGYIRFDRNAYSTHCKDYREFKEWEDNRNEERYKDNLKGEQGFDHKNMLHCIRLLNMAKDISQGKGIVVKRPEAEYLLSIRRGEVSYDDILDRAESMVEEIKDLFDKSNLPKSVDEKVITNLLLKIRTWH